MWESQLKELAGSMDLELVGGYVIRFFVPLPKLDHRGDVSNVGY